MASAAAGTHFLARAVAAEPRHLDRVDAPGLARVLADAGRTVGAATRALAR
jgi:hypothetical protein